MRRTEFILSTTLLCFFITTNTECQEGRFYWAFYDKITDTHQILISDCQEYTIKPQSSLQFYFLPMKNSNLYLLLFDSQKNLTLLFPQSLNEFTNEYNTFEQEITALTDMSINEKYELQILVSAMRIKELEKQLFQYQILKESDNLDKAGTKISLNIYTFIQKLIRSQIFKKRSQENFTEIAGGRRSENNWLEDKILKIEFQDFYFKIYSLE